MSVCANVRHHRMRNTFLVDHLKTVGKCFCVIMFNESFREFRIVQTLTFIHPLINCNSIYLLVVIIIKSRNMLGGKFTTISNT